jgi:hypothetical protein
MHLSVDLLPFIPFPKSCRGLRVPSVQGPPMLKVCLTTEYTAVVPIASRVSDPAQPLHQLMWRWSRPPAITYGARPAQAWSRVADVSRPRRSTRASDTTCHRQAPFRPRAVWVDLALACGTLLAAGGAEREAQVEWCCSDRQRRKALGWHIC